MSTATDPTPTELALICGVAVAELEAVMARRAESAHAGRLEAGQAIALAEALGVEEMGPVGVRLAEIARLRAQSEQELSVALEAIDDALSAWLERSHAPVPSFLEQARRVLPDALYEPVAAVWENAGRGQRRPDRSSP